MKYVGLLFCCLFACQSISSQTSKHIDRFSANKYYLAFNLGAGLLKDSLVKNEGLCINYTFESGMHSSFTLIRNYGVYPQDYSFMPRGFALFLKGGTKYDQVRLRLWEDINMNGEFDGADEVYASAFSLLGDSVLHSLQFPISSFERIAGHGNHHLDLNRIRAWDIEVRSQTNYLHSGVLQLNDLQFESNYQPQNVDSAPLTSTFITLNSADSSRNAYWTQERWQIQMAKMKQIGIRKIIIQYSIHQNKAWYAPSSAPFVQNNEPCLNRIFAAAEKLGMQVVLGLAFSESWHSSDKSLATTYSDLVRNSMAVIDDLYRLFGSIPSFAGWYIPQEINDYDWQTVMRKKLLFECLQQIAAYAHTKAIRMPVMISPYFNLWQPADVLETWYNDLLDVAQDVDCVCPQDGIGTSLKDVHLDLPHYGKVIKAACDRHGKRFGVVLEAFRQQTGWPIDSGVFSAQPSHLNQLKDQIQEACGVGAEELILFNWDYLIVD